MATKERLISAEFLFDRVTDRIYEHLKKGENDLANECNNILGMVVGTPTADAVEVVLCKDCKHWMESWVARDGCHSHGYCHLEDTDDVVVGRWNEDFCSYGERKEND